MRGKLISRNVTVDGHRTSLRLEGESWAALDQICAVEGSSVHDLCTLIDKLRQGASRTAMVRAFIVSYFRTAANAAGEMQGGIASGLLKPAE